MGEFVVFCGGEFGDDVSAAADYEAPGALGDDVCVGYDGHWGL